MHRVQRFLCAAASLVSMSAMANAQRPTTTGDRDVGQPAAHLHFAGHNASGDTRLVIDQTQVASLAARSRSLATLAISATESLTLDLTRFEVIAPDAQFIRGGQQQPAGIMPRPNVAFFRGSIAGDANSRVYLALSTTRAGHGLGLITRSSGEHWQVASDRSGEQPGLVIQRGSGAVPDFDHFCSMIPLEDGGADGGLAGSSSFGEAKGPRVLNVAVDSDQRFWQLFNDDEAALEYIAMVCGAVSDIYIRDLNMSVALRFARIWPNGGEPFVASNLSAFRSYWLDNEDMDGLNLVHMFSGARDTSYGGVAYLSNACTGLAFGISAFLLGGFPAPAESPNLGNWDVVVVAHEMGHNLGTPHTHDLDPPIDTCADGSDERGTIMSYCHTRPGGLLNTDMHMHSVIEQVILDDNPLVPDSCLWHDCNGNLINDVEDIIFGVSLDLNGDDVPDECQDCNGNGVLDPLDIAGGAADVNGNGVPDSCESDCNGNGLPDRWERDQQPGIDLNGNNIPDECEPDCDGNGIADFIDIASGTHTDIDRNSRPDVCDDCNANSVPDWIDYERAGNIFIAQADGNQIANPVREYHAQSGVLSGDYAPPSVLDAMDLAFGPDRQLYVISWFNNQIVRIDVDAGSSAIHVTPAAAGFTAMSALAFDSQGSLYSASPVNGEIRKYAPNGAFISVFADVTGSPWDLAFGPNGNLFVLTDSSGVIEIDASSGTVIGTFASGANLDSPRGMCFLPSGELLVTDFDGDFIRRFSANGVDLGIWNDEYGVTSPWGIAVGPNGHVYTARRLNPVRIIEYTPDGRYQRAFVRGDGDLTHPTAIAFRPASPADADQNGVLDVCEDACPADISPPPAGNGTVNVSDLLLVISSWGACPPGPPCSADCAPPGGDGVVNVADLLLVISSWGACP